MNRKSMGNIKVMMRLITLIFPLIGYMLLAIVMGVLGFLCAIFIPVSGILLVMKGIGTTITFTYLQIFFFMIILAVFRGILHYLEQACNHYIAFRILALIRDKVFLVLRKLAPAKLEGRDRGNLISLITQDIELLEVFYAHTISPILIAIITCIILLILFASMHIGLMLIALLAYIAIGVLLPLYITKLGRSKGNIYRDKFGEMSSFTLESLRGMQEIIQFGRGEERLFKMNEKSKELNEVQKELKAFEGISSALSNLCVLGFSFIMLMVSLMLHDEYALPFAYAILSSVLLLSSFGPVLALSSLSNNLLVTLASGRRVLTLLDEQPIVEDIEDKDSATFGSIDISKLSFAYDDQDVLQNINTTIPAGSIIGIHGKSGSGKSTLLKLIMRFWQVEHGSIHINQKCIGQINTRELRTMESYVTQETCLFHDTIENNIKIANLHASAIEVEEACRKASIHDFIMTLPHGYQTHVSELGESLSGGEKQRIAIARAFLHNGDCILLDEPTSNLDVLNEAVILKSLQATKDKTILLVTHRSSTMKIADHIIKIDSGRVC